MQGWPSVATREDAQKAIGYGVTSAGFVAAVTGTVATISVVMHKPIVGIDAWAYVDAAAFGIVCWRVYKRSRAWAVAGLVLFVLEKGVQLATNPVSGGAVLAVVLLLGFIHGVRGTFAMARLERAAASAQAMAATASSSSAAQ